MRLVVSTMRLKPIAKNTVGGTTSFSSLIRNAERPDLGIADSSVLSGADNPGCSSKLTTSQQKVPQENFRVSDLLQVLRLRHVLESRLRRALQLRPTGY